MKRRTVPGILRKSMLTCLLLAGLFTSAAHATEEAIYIERGNAVSAMLFANLLTTLQQKIAEAGVADAIAFCKIEALPLTHATAESQKEGISSLRRIGIRTRNPANMQDDVDREVLREFLKNWKPDSPPGPLLRTVEIPDGGKEIRYYRPIPVAASCLACHGDKDKIEPLALRKLQELYPDDEATGFAEGELRGAIVVTFREKLQP